MDNIGLMSETVNFIQGSKRNYDSSTMQGGFRNFMNDDYSFLRTGCMRGGVTSNVTINGLWVEFSGTATGAPNLISVDYASSLIINEIFISGVPSKVKINKRNVDIHWNDKSSIVSPSGLPKFIIKDDVPDNSISIYFDFAVQDSGINGWNHRNSMFWEYFDLIDRGIIRSFKTCMNVYHNFPDTSLFDLSEYGDYVEGFKTGRITLHCDNIGKILFTREDNFDAVLYKGSGGLTSIEIQPPMQRTTYGIVEIVYRIKIKPEIVEPDLTDKDNICSVWNCDGKDSQGYVYPNLIMIPNSVNPNEWSEWRKMRYLDKGTAGFQSFRFGANVMVEVAVAMFSSCYNKSKLYDITNKFNEDGSVASSVLTFYEDRKVKQWLATYETPNIDASITRCFDMYNNRNKTLQRVMSIDGKFYKITPNNHVECNSASMPPADKCTGVTFYQKDRKRLVLSNGTTWVNMDGTNLDTHINEWTTIE